MKKASLLNYLKLNGKISLVDMIIILGITGPRAMISDLKKQLGSKCIERKSEVLKDLRGHSFKCPVYSLTDEGRRKIFPVKKEFPAWITDYK